MAKAPEPAVTADAIIFELERFERSNGHLILRGRWFGVRGRRFVRPTLTLEVGGERRRALADLDDKPWAAEDGEPWRASFPWGKTGRVEESELSVAPDITIQLPAPGGKRTRAQRLAAQPRRDAISASFGMYAAPVAEAPAAAPDVSDAPEAPEIAPQAPEIAPDAAAAEAVPSEPAPPPPDPEALQAEIEALRGELARAETTSAGARDELEKVRGELARVQAELEDAKSGLAQGDGELDATRSELAAARAAREAALRNAAQAEADRDDAVTRVSEVEAERDALAAEKAKLTAALEERRSAVEQLTRQHNEAVTSRGAALVMRGATQALPAYEGHVGWLRRALVVVVLLGIVFAVLIVLNVL